MWNRKYIQTTLFLTEMPPFYLGSHFVLVCVAPSILFVRLRTPEPRINTPPKKTPREHPGYLCCADSEQQVAALRNIFSNMTAPNRKVIMPFFLNLKKKYTKPHAWMNWINSITIKNVLNSWEYRLWKNEWNGTCIAPHVYFKVFLWGFYGVFVHD